MARFDVYRTPGGMLLLDCQADFLMSIETRLVAPLFPVDTYKRALPRLHPIFDLADMRLMMMTTLLAGIPKTELGRQIGSLADQQDAILNAIGMLLSGF